MNHENTTQTMNSNTTASATLTTPSHQPPQPQAVELLTQEEMARVLGITRRTLHTWVQNKIVPMIKIRGYCRFDFAKVSAALEKYQMPVAALRSLQQANASPQSSAC